jgi:hypothetical protein
LPIKAQPVPLGKSFVDDIVHSFGAEAPKEVHFADKLLSLLLFLSACKRN